MSVEAILARYSHTPPENSRLSRARIRAPIDDASSPGVRDLPCTTWHGHSFIPQRRRPESACRPLTKLGVELERLAHGARVRVQYTYTCARQVCLLILFVLGSSFGSACCLLFLVWQVRLAWALPPLRSPCSHVVWLKTFSLVSACILRRRIRLV